MTAYCLFDCVSQPSPVLDQTITLFHLVAKIASNFSLTQVIDNLIVSIFILFVTCLDWTMQVL